MKLSLSLFSTLALLVAGAQAQLTFEQLQAKCQGNIVSHPLPSHPPCRRSLADSGSLSDVQIIVGEYASGVVTTFVPNQCVPYYLPDGARAVQLHLCKSVTCYSNPFVSLSLSRALPPRPSNMPLTRITKPNSNPDCTGGAVPPVPIPIPASTPLLNAADISAILGEGATCQGLGIF